jgi:hypothetical protein
MHQVTQRVTLVAQSLTRSTFHVRLPALFHQLILESNTVLLRQLPIRLLIISIITKPPAYHAPSNSTPSSQSSLSHSPLSLIQLTSINHTWVILLNARFTLKEVKHECRLHLRRTLLLIILTTTHLRTHHIVCWCNATLHLQFWTNFLFNHLLFNHLLFNHLLFNHFWPHHFSSHHFRSHRQVYTWFWQRQHVISAHIPHLLEEILHSFHKPHRELLLH